ncbi:putative metallo-hydrolase YycJ [subsurface metagenome]
MDSRGLDEKKIKAILLTHEHNDHIKGVGITARKLRVPVYGTKGSLYCKKDIFNGTESLIPIESGVQFKLGPLRILPFSVSHDTSEPVQFKIFSGKKNLAVATDLGFVSHLVEQNLKGTQLIVIEANHDVDMLLNGPYPWKLKQRIMSRTGHLSNRNAAELLFNLSLQKKLTNVVLAHISKENNDAAKAEKEVRDIFERFDCSLPELIIAEQDTATPVIEI